MKQKKKSVSSKRQQQQYGSMKFAIRPISSFLLGCLLTAVIILNFQALQRQNEDTIYSQRQGVVAHAATAIRTSSSNNDQRHMVPPPRTTRVKPSIFSERPQEVQESFDVTIQRRRNDIDPGDGACRSFSQLRILVGLVAFDFSQIPHLEQVLDAYGDLSLAVTHVEVVIYTTVPWPVTYIDMMETRFFGSNNFNIQIQIFSPSLRLYLVNEHRKYFYEEIENYDLFIYSEDDILIPPTTIATYYEETCLLSNPSAVQIHPDPKDPNHAVPSDFNIGVVRYEYQYPVDIIDDSTRHVTQNVSRIYWEHLADPAYEPISTISLFSASSTANASTTTSYVTMKNHHQGLFIATRSLLKAWATRCEFHTTPNRPASKKNPGQPTEGTQRVWISSNQLFGKRHCNVQQILPIEKFGALTVWHLPNKNYRRIGRKGRLGHGQYRGAKADVAAGVAETEDGTAGMATKPIPTAMQWHLEFRQQYPKVAGVTKGVITMLDKVHGRGSNAPLLVRRMNEYNEYVERGRILSEEDMKHIDLVEAE